MDDEKFAFSLEIESKLLYGLQAYFVHGKVTKNDLQNKRQLEDRGSAPRR